MTKVNVEERANMAVSLFCEGYNCAQAVYVTFSDIMGLDKTLASRIIGSFGGGIGKMHETCGTVSGMVAVISMLHDTSNNKVAADKVKNYEYVRSVVEKFREQNKSIVCRELRSDAAVEKISCKELVRRASIIISEHIN
ncbi:MAG: C-GCAxxG-C-C family protein, partial [Rikenellaceae bacterium]